MKQSIPIRILQLVPEPLPTYRADVAILFGKYLPRNNVQCDIVGKTGGMDLTDQGFASVLRSGGHGGRWRQDFDHFLKCLKTILSAHRTNCDLIQVRDMVWIGYFAFLISRLKGIPFVYWVSYLISDDRIRRARSKIKEQSSLFYRVALLKGLIENALLHKILLPCSNHVVLQSDAMKALMVSRGLPEKKCTAIPMGVDTETLKPAGIKSFRLAGWEEIPVIAYLGTMDSLRQLDKLVDALVIVRTIHPNARLLFIGDSDTQGDCEKLLSHALSLSLKEAVHITGWLPSSQAWELLVGADVAVSFFPRGEILDTNSPTKILEYLALGVPCVGNDNPDQAQLLSLSGAGLLTDSSVESLADAISNVLSHPDAARKRAKSGPGYIEATRSYRVLAGTLANLYRFLIA